MVKRVVAAIVVVVLSVVACVWHLSRPYVYPEPGECDALRELSQYRSDTAADMQRLGCADDLFGTPSPSPESSAR